MNKYLSSWDIHMCPFWGDPLYQSNHVYNNINDIQWAYACKYTMVQFDFKIKGCMFLDTWRFYLQHIYLPTNILVLAMQGGCVGLIYSTVKLKKE